MSIQTIHILHHTHVDFGYTDLPTTMARLQQRYTREALAMIERNKEREDASRFRWTIEVSDVAHSFLATATDRQKEQLLRARAEGFLDLGALPFHPTGFSGAAEWEAIERRFDETWNLLRPRVAILDDVNGLAWGLIPKLLDRGVCWMSSALNLHSGRPPRPRPAFFHWEGPDGRSLLVWLGLPYPEAYFFFHAEMWRRGPVPHSSDIFYNPPEPGDIWADEEAALVRAEAVLRPRLAELADYPFSDLGLQATNMWRLDNDPPFEGLCDFVRAWNASGRSPQIRLSTFEQFFEAASRDPAMAAVETVRGDWVNWWADGQAAFPRENTRIAKAVRILSDLPGVAHVCQSTVGNEAADLAAAAWWKVSLFNEHTADGFNAMSEPARELSLGHKSQKSALAYQSAEDARSALAEVLRQTPGYVPATRGNAVSVINPSDAPRSGWIEIPAEAMRRPVTSLLDEATGEAFPLLETAGPVWSRPMLEKARPYERPNDTFPFITALLRVFIPEVPAHSSRRFLLGDYPVAAVAETAPRWSWTWNKDEGRLTSLKQESSGREVLDATAKMPFGGLVFDIDRTFGARDYLTALDTARVRQGRERSFAQPREWESGDDFYGKNVRLVLEHPSCHRIGQHWLLHRLTDRLEITTTLWLRESFEPSVFAVAFPFATTQPQVAYTSMGVPTRVGHDQMPGCCGDFALTEGVIRIGDDQNAITLRCPEVPLAAFGQLRVHEGTRSALPENAHVFSIFELTHWNTNFPHILAGKVTLHHVVDLGPSASDALYALPVF